MEYWIKIGITMAMTVMISAGSRKMTTTSYQPDYSLSSNLTPSGNAATGENLNSQCSKEVINGTVCDGNRKCPINNECANVSACPCMDGYELIEFKVPIPTTVCEDISECAKNLHVCGAHSLCYNTAGGYYCTCENGYRKKNVTKFCPTESRQKNACVDINECLENPNICGPNRTCTNTGGSYKCDCNRGFQNVSNQCIDIDECEEIPNICGPYSKCKNTNGSYECICNKGFKNISNNCTVMCKQSNETQTTCNNNKLECILQKFTEKRKPLCNDNSSLERLGIDKFLDDLDDLIEKFSSSEQRLQIAGKMLKAIEIMVQNLGYLFSKHIQYSNKNSFLGAKVINSNIKDKEVSLSNRNSSIRLGASTALGNAYTSIVGCLEYANLGKLLEGANLQQDSKNMSVKLVSPVVSVFLGMPTDTSNLSEPIQMHINFSEKVNLSRIHCAFWSEENAWSTEGCVTLEKNQYGIVCNCTHLTSFAVLMALEKLEESWTLTLITRIGLSISIICLVLAILTFCLCRFLRGTRNTIHIHLCASLLLAHCIFLLGIEATSNKTLCGIVAALLHFFYLSSFCWMSLEGLELYLMLVTVFKTQVKTRYLLMAGYGVPTVIVIISAAVYSKGYGTCNYCWLSLDRNFIWSFMGPVCVIILVNCGIFVLTVWKLAEKMTTINPDQGKLKRIRTLTVTSIAQLCILGCCWAFGFLMFGKTSLFFIYAFTICNILQGVQIFLLHCLMNKRIRETYSKFICAIAHFRSPIYSEFSNSTNVNTQSRGKPNKESGL